MHIFGIIFLAILYYRLSMGHGDESFYEDIF